jgi:N-acetylglucosamine-6-sulfatase
MKKTAIALLAAATVAALTASAHTGGAAQPARPNVVVIMTDDQTAESIRVMANVKRLIGAQGATFKNSFVSFPLCCPSRATYLTGQYAHNHRVTSNVAPYGGYDKFAPLQANSLPVWMTAAGYHTAHIGKFLNGYGRSQPTFVPPGWHEWYGSVDPYTYRFWDYTLNENGTLMRYGKSVREYQGDVYTRKAVDVVRGWARETPKTGGERETPLFLSVAYLAPHGGAPQEPDDPVGLGTPARAPRHRGKFASQQLPQPPSFNETDVSDKPEGVRFRPRLDEAKIAAVTNLYRQELESLLAVDEGVSSIVSALRAAGELENTLIIFTSDNGFFHGEHRLVSGKGRVYDPAVRVPLLMRGPGVPRRVSVTEQVANVDLAATIVDAAHAVPGRRLDGVSLLPLARDPGRFLGRDILLETRTFSALRTPRYLYVNDHRGERELYDLERDPFQLRSRHRDPGLTWLRLELSKRLARLRACKSNWCRVVPRVWVKTSCTRKAGPTAFLRGEDLEEVRLVRFRVGGTVVAAETKRPFRTKLPTGAQAVRATTTLADGRVVTLDRAAARCPSGQR